MGALPSGSDPEEFDVGEYGIDGAGLSDLARRTQENIEAALKAQVQNGGWKQTSSILFQTLDPSLPYTTAIMKAIAEALLGSLIGADTIDQIFDVIQAWSDGLQQAWEDFWSAFGIDINVVQESLDTIFAVLGDIANPEAWQAAWDAFIDILTQLGLTAESQPHTFDLTKLVTDLTKNLLKPLGLILDPDSPLNAARLFGQFVAPISWLINKPPEMLWNPGFSGAISMSPGSGWSWDSGVYRTVPVDAEAGSAKAVCSSTGMGLRSNAFRVEPGQGLDISVEVLWHALSGSGKPIRVTLEGSGSGAPVSFLVGEVGVSDGVDPLGWTGEPSGAKAATISNTWEVPEGITDVYMRLGVTSAATAGSVWFDAASVLMEVSGVPTEWLSELVDSFTQIFSPFASLDSLFDPEKWESAWEGVLSVLGLSMSENAIIANPGSLWARLFRVDDLVAALKADPWFGWLFTLIDSWLQPVLKIGKAASDFGDTFWHLVTTFVTAPSLGAWSTLVAAITTAWNTMVDAVLAAWGSPKTHADFVTPADAAVAALKNNTITGWLFGNSGLKARFTDFSNALWDYLLGGNRYDGVTRTIWSTAAGGKLELAWRNLWAQITGGAPAAAPAPASAQSLWNGISSNFIQSTLAGIWEPLGNLGSLLTKAKNLINALWDYAFGGALYNGSAVTALSPTAGQNVSAAFNALAAQFGSTATAKTKGQIGSAVASSVLSGLFPTNTKFQESFAWLGEMFQNGAMPSTPPADPVGDALNQAWEWLSKLMGWQTTTEVTQKNAQNFQISALTGGYRNPIWACRYPVGDVSYPECMNVMLPVYNATGLSPRPNSGNPAYVVGESPWLAQAGYFDIFQNESRGAFISVSNTAVMDKLGMFCGGATAGLNNLVLELFRIEPGVNLTRIFYADATAKIYANPGYAGYFEVDIPGGGILAQAGEQYLVRLRNSSSVAGTVQLRAIGGVVGSPSVGIRTTNSTDTNKTTYTWSELQAVATTTTPFALFASQGQVATDQLYADDFNRSGIGALWYLQSTNSDQLGISLGTASYMGGTDGHQHGLYTRPLASDRMWVEGNFYNLNSSTPVGLILCANRDLSQMVYLYINNAVARIYTGSATSLTQRATVSTLFNSVPWAIYYDPPTKKYTVLKDGKATGSGWAGLSWTDSTNLISHGYLYRYGGIRISKSGLFYGGNVDNWVLKDWS